VTAIVTLMRPRQWIKNVVVFAGVVFAGRLENLLFVEHVLGAFAIFCLASSGIYVFNDMLDVEKDRLHPEKRTRPIAAGQVGKGTAFALALTLWAATTILAFRLGPRFGLTVAAFIALNALYTTWLKRGAIVDVLSISVSFMLRAIGGVQVLRDLDPSVTLSHWLLLCTFFLALVMSFGKRRSELVLLDESASSHRSVLREYSVEFLDVIIPLVSACAILAYSIYSIWPETVHRLGTDKLVYTVPFVVYGFLRYLLLVRERGLGGNPSEILFRDRALLASVMAWAAAIVVILYFG